MKFIVAQIGARRGYAVPAILERAGMLERFYTDLCADMGLGRALSRCARYGSAAPLQRLARRSLPREILSKTRTFARPNLSHFLRELTAGRDPRHHYFEGLRLNEELGSRVSAEGFGDATALYTMMDEFGPLLSAAQARGLKVFSEIYILLSTDRLMKNERLNFPGWEENALDYDTLDREVRPHRPLFTSVDYAICPSEAVRDDAVKNFGFSAARCAVVPYGMNPELLNVRPEPVRGRVLFAGTADLRKGIHYFAMAAEKLRSSGATFAVAPSHQSFLTPSPHSEGGEGRGEEGRWKAAPLPNPLPTRSSRGEGIGSASSTAHRPPVHRLEFRVAGNVTPRVASQPVCRHLNFLGRIPRSEMAREFANADVFVLPSLAEGSAEVTYEALACGLPVITTKAAGSVVRDGIEGRIVPERDPVALAEAIREVAEDREKRDRMAHAARERARDYTWEKYGERLVHALKNMGESIPS